MRVNRHLPSAVALVLLVASAATAQTSSEGGPDPETVRVRLGALWLNPSISLPNLGVDTNVFNDPPHATPKSDFTLTLTPRADMWLPMGRTWLSGSVAEDIVWYQTYATERSANSSYNLAWKAPFNRLIISTTAGWLRTRARPGFEIDSRAHRTEPSYAGAIELRGFPRTFVGVRGARSKVSFDEEASFDGRRLKDELDRTTTSAAITLRHELTPLTSVTFSAGRTEQRFAASIARDSMADEYHVGVSFDPAALIKGSATFGYTRYRPESDQLPPFTGATVDVNLIYTMLGSTRLSGSIRRNLESSYDLSQPYYLQTGGSVSVAQQILGPLDVVGRFGSHRLQYRNRAGEVMTVPDRTDRVRSYGFGMGYHLGQDLRVGFNVDKERRSSLLPDRQFEGLRYGSSVTYGL